MCSVYIMMCSVIGNLFPLLLVLVKCSLTIPLSFIAPPSPEPRPLVRGYQVRIGQWETSLIWYTERVWSMEQWRNWLRNSSQVYRYTYRIINLILIEQFPVIRFVLQLKDVRVSEIMSVYEHRLQVMAVSVSVQLLQYRHVYTNYIYYSRRRRTFRNSWMLRT